MPWYWTTWVWLGDCGNSAMKARSRATAALHFPWSRTRQALPAPTLFLKNGLPNEHDRIISEGDSVPSYSGSPSVPSYVLV